MVPPMSQGPSSAEGQKIRRTPGPRGLPFTGNLWNLATEPLTFLQDLEASHGGLCQARIGHLRYHLVSDPDLIEQVLWPPACPWTTG